MLYGENLSLNRQKWLAVPIIFFVSCTSELIMGYEDGNLVHSSSRTISIQGWGRPNIYFIVFSNKQGNGLRRNKKI